MSLPPLAARAPRAPSPWLGRLTLAVALLAVSVMLGWWLDVQLLKSVVPGLTTMKFNTALCFLCSAVSLWWRGAIHPSRPARVGALLLIAVVVCIAAGTLFEYSFRTNIGLDEFFIYDREHAGTSYPPGRLAPATALCFLLFAAALLTLNRLPALSQSLTLAMFLVAVIGLIGYLYNLPTLYGAAHYTSMAVHTIAGFVLLSFASWTARRDQGWLSWLLAPVSFRTRQLLAMSVGLPILLGWLSRAGERQGWYNPEFTLALYTVLLIVLTGAVIGWTARRALVIELQRQQAEVALRSSEARFRALADSMPQIVWTANARGELTYFNERWFRVTGIVPSGDGVPQQWQKTLHPDDAERAYQIWRQAMDTGEPYSCEFRRWDARVNEYRWYLSRAEPVRDENGNIERWYGTATDIEDLKRAQAEVEASAHELEARVARRTDELRHANQELESFSYSVSHDLRAPLRSLDSFSRFLLEDYGDRLDAEGRNYLDRIRVNAQRMGQLISDLLALSRLSRTELRRETVHLSSLVHGIIDELRQRQPNREVQVTIASGLLTSGDSRLLRVALENLLGNAWKFTAQTPQAEIEFGILDSPERVYFLRDNGAGFDMRFASQLFTPFQRLHQAHEFEGTGIGLATVQRVIHRHSGRIWAEGTVGAGATFYFTLGCDDETKSE